MLAYDEIALNLGRENRWRCFSIVVEPVDTFLRASPSKFGIRGVDVKIVVGIPKIIPPNT